MSIFGIPFKKELEDKLLELLKEILTDENLTIKVGDEVIYQRGEKNEENNNIRRGRTRVARECFNRYLIYK